MRDVAALRLAAADPRVPWYAKAVALAVAAYALSPIDLIPDFVPILGYLDDLILVPLGIVLATKLVPPALMTKFRDAAREQAGHTPFSWWGAAIVAAVWIGVTVWAARAVWAG